MLGSCHIGHKYQVVPHGVARGQLAQTQLTIAKHLTGFRMPDEYRIANVAGCNFFRGQKLDAARFAHEISIKKMRPLSAALNESTKKLTVVASHLFMPQRMISLRPSTADGTFGHGARGALDPDSGINVHYDRQY